MILEKKQKIIEAQDKKLRAMVDAKNPDTTLQPIVNQLIQTVKEWDTIAQPIQLSKRSRGERHIASFEIAWRVQKLTVDLFNEYLKYDFALQFLNMLLEVFAEVPEIVERITRDKKDLETQIHQVKGIEKFENINTQVEKLKEAADMKKPDYTLTPMVNQLIQTVKTWETSGQPPEANGTVALTVRDIALYLWNEHQKLDFARRIASTLFDVFVGIEVIAGQLYVSVEIAKQLAADTMRLDQIEKDRKHQNPPEEGGCLDTGCLLQIVIFGILAIVWTIFRVLE